MKLEKIINDGDDPERQSNGASQLLSLFEAPSSTASNNEQVKNENENTSTVVLDYLEAGIQLKNKENFVLPEKPTLGHERQRTIVTSNQSRFEMVTSDDQFQPSEKQGVTGFLTHRKVESTNRKEKLRVQSQSLSSHFPDNKKFTFNQANSNLETTSLLTNEQKQSTEYEYKSSALSDLFTPPKPKCSECSSYSIPTKTTCADSGDQRMDQTTSVQNRQGKQFFSLPSLQTVTTTIMGSIIFLLYHLVFALALASAVSASFSSATAASPLLCPLAKMAVLSSIFGGPVLVHIFGKELPSLYPCLDLFLVPFLSQLAHVVDETIQSNSKATSPISLTGDVLSLDPMQYNNLFLNTFAVLSSLGMILSGILCILASKIKLANLGGFLPNAVLCGFFSSVGITLWTSAFNVDTGGLSVQDVNSSNIFDALLHHLPSLFVGILIFWVGSKYMIPFVVVSIMVVYLIMVITQTTLGEAQKLGWFWTEQDFQYEYSYGSQVVGFTLWSPPFPLGVIHSVWTLDFDFQAVRNGLSTVCAMAFIYALRCSLHAPALIKNKPKILSIIENTHKLSAVDDNSNKKNDLVREISTESMASTQNDDCVEKFKKHQVDLLKVLKWYGNVHILSGIIGGFACMPSIGTAPTITKLGAGAEGKSPQYASVAFLLLFYLTNFKPVQYIPKIAFSSLLVLCFLDLMNAWFVQSYKMTKDKYEWLVVPLIILFSFLVGMLASVALGVAMSTFLFVASFYRTGVVKYIDNGLLVRSTVERNAQDADWLDQNGDLIQVMVLQNYLFFGNSSSCLNYISSMFEEVTVPDNAKFNLPPIPKYIVVDFSICSGMDTSAVSVFSEVIDICEQNKCKVIFAGMSRDLREMMKFGDVIKSKKRNYLYFRMNLETALGDAEDGLLSYHSQFQDVGKGKKHDINVKPSDGFLSALKQIDNQHGTEFQTTLRDLERFTHTINLKKKNRLFQSANGDGVIAESDRGIFFIEYGLIRVERDSSYTLSRSVNSMNNIAGYDLTSSQWASNEGSIGQFKARTATIGKKASDVKLHRSRSRESHTFRLARIGPGWVIGGLESCAGLRNPGIYTAVSDCRLHHLPHSVVEKIEKENPGLILNLFKMLSHLMARRQDVTIEQLATLHSIISSPPVKKPMSRLTTGALQRAGMIAQQRLG